jgi:hypothetical protein
MNLEDLVFDVNGRVYTDNGATVVELTNPITRYRCRLDPPYEVAEGGLEELDEKFQEYCVAAWEGPVVDEATGWRERINPAVVDPYRVLDGTQPLPDLKQLAGDLVRAFGFLAAHHAVDELDPIRQAAALGRERPE